MIKNRNFWIVTLLLVSVTTLILVTSCNIDVGGDNGGDKTAIEGLPPDFARLAEVWQLLKAEHFEGQTLDARELSDGAIRGMLQALDDPYAAYLDAEQYSVETQDYQGFFYGIGAEVGMRDGRVTIIAPMPGSPAEKAGIKPGDVILAIDGESAEGIMVLEAVTKIRGEKGTLVDLLVQHENSSVSEEITIVRDTIKLDSVRFNMLDNSIGHLRITNFAEGTNQEMLAAIERFREAQGRGLILDLRNNPGGLLSSVVNVASQFLDDGLVLYQIDADGKRTDWKAHDGGKATDIPMVVLVNSFSASASEVLSGALIDHQRATVIGVTTFGKGSVNTLRQLQDGSGIYFTVSRWYTPSGTLIEGKGITPDIIVENPPDSSADLQLDRAIETLQQQLVATSSGRR